MKSSTLLSFAGLVLATAGPAHLAAALDPTTVPADSRWVVHADFAAMRDTIIGRELITLIEQQKTMGAESPLQPDMAQIAAALGRVTAYGDNLSGDPENMDGALVLEGTDKLRAIAEGWIAAVQVSEPGMLEEIRTLPFEAYRIHGEVFVGLPDAPVILVSRSATRLQQALAGYERRVESLARKSGPLSHLLPREDNYYLFAASVVPTDLVAGEENSPQARVLQMAQSGSLQVGENDETLQIAAALQAADADNAVRLSKILNGLVAILSLAQSEDTELVAFINSVAIQQTKRDVSVRMNYPSQNLITMVESQVARFKADAEAARQVADQREQFTVEGVEVATWRADAELGGPVPDATNFTQHVVDNVALQPGARLIVNVRMDDLEGGRVDWIEVTPIDQPAAAQRIEAEYLSLRGMMVNDSEFASGGALVKVTNEETRTGSAQLFFTGAPGDYRVTVGYVDENDGHAQFKLSVAGPAPVAPAASTTP